MYVTKCNNKYLKLSKDNREEFVNEVASISRTSHVNIVSLLGFCLEGRKRALIYEFMPNGSLENLVYKDNNALQTNPHLEWEKLLQISIGIVLICTVVVTLKLYILT